MPEEHYVMTIQPGASERNYRKEIGDNVTVSGIIETDGMTPDQVYNRIYAAARFALSKANPGVGDRHPIMAGASVIVYRREINEPIGSSGAENA